MCLSTQKLGGAASAVSVVTSEGSEIPQVEKRGQPQSGPRKYQPESKEMSSMVEGIVKCISRGGDDMIRGIFVHLLD